MKQPYLPSLISLIILIGGVKDAISQVESGQSKPTESNPKPVAASRLSKIAAAKAPQIKNPTIQLIAAKGNHQQQKQPRLPPTPKVANEC